MRAGAGGCRPSSDFSSREEICGSAHKALRPRGSAQAPPPAPRGGLGFPPLSKIARQPTTPHISPTTRRSNPLDPPLTARSPRICAAFSHGLQEVCRDRPRRGHLLRPGLGQALHHRRRHRSQPRARRRPGRDHGRPPPRARHQPHHAHRPEGRGEAQCLAQVRSGPPARPARRHGLGPGPRRRLRPRSSPPAAPPRRQRPPFARARPQRLTFSPPPRARRQLAALWKSEDVQGKWDATNWAKKIQKRKLRASMTDFDRFQVMLARKERSAARKAA